MDEEMEEIEIGGMDLLGLEDACTIKAFISILPTQIQILKESLAKEKSQNKLGFQSTPQKDNKNTKETIKKRPKDGSAKNQHAWHKVS